MNWVRNNRFLSTFLGVVLVAAGALTYLLVTSLNRYEEVDSNYKTQVAELKRLQGLEPYPDAASEKTYEQKRQEYTMAVNDLQADLASHEPATVNPPPSPIQFQDRLRQVVADVSGLAQQLGVALPEGFYLGFEQYKGSPPEAAATPLLDKQLNAISDLVTILIKTRIDKLSSIKRAPLPQESGASAAGARSGPGAAKAAPAGGDLVTKQTLEIAFTTLPSSFRDSINNITHDKRLYIVRALQVKNQVDKGPARDDGTPVPGGAGQPPGPTPAPTAPGPDGVPNPQLPEKGPPPLRYVVGQEKLDVIARIELARVLPPAPAGH